MSNIFNTIKESVSIRDAMERYGIEVNRNGMCRCPFHNDRHPSMKLYDRNYYCFGCHENGDVINLVAKLYNLPMKAAAEKLAADFGISINTAYEPVVKPVRVLSEWEWLLKATDTLLEYRDYLKTWREQYEPTDREAPMHPLFVESLRKLDTVELLLDMATCSDQNERRALYLNCRHNLAEIEERLTAIKSEHRKEAV